MTRNEAIAAAYQAGVTLSALAVEHGLTPERVRQILAAQGVARRNSADYIEAAYDKFVAADGPAVEALFSELRSIPATVAAFSGRVPAAWVRRLLAPRAGEQRRPNGGRPAGAREARYDDVFLLDALRVRAAGGRLTAPGYIAARQPGDPAVSTYVARFGSWGAAVEAAGLTGGKRHSVARRRWTVDELRAAVAEYVAAMRAAGIQPTVLGYETYRLANPHLPSYTTIRIQTQQRWAQLAGLD